MAEKEGELETLAKLREHLERNLETADELALTYGLPVGRIHRLEPSVAQERGIRCVCTIKSDVLLEDGQTRWVCTLGNYLVAVDLKTLDFVALRITSVHREDVMAMAGGPATSLPPAPDASSLITPIRVEAAPVMALSSEELQNGEGNPKVVNYVLDPQSPVFIPLRAYVLEKLLGIPVDGVSLGVLSSGDRPLIMPKTGEAPRVKLRLKALYQHVLVVGTTGAGKTTAVKNLVYELVKNHGAGVLAMDSTQEMLQMAFPSRVKTGNGLDLRRLVYGVDADSLRLKVVVPLTTNLVQREGLTSLTDLALLYIRLVFGPIMQLHGLEVDPKMQAHKRSQTVDIALDGAEITLIPYAFQYNLLDDPESFCRKLKQMNPFFTSQARATLTTVLRTLLKLESEESLRDMWSLVEALNLNYEEIKKNTKIHPNTLDNIVRNVRNLAEWGIFGVELDGKEIGEAPMGLCIDGGVLTCVDLSILEALEPQSAFLIHMLDRAFWWKRRSRQVGRETPPLFVVVDEAHNYFPQGGLIQEDVIYLIASKLQRIAREGRKERLGLILATQFPRDIHAVVRSLCNTRIIFRVDRTDVPVLDLPREYEEIATRMDDLTAIVKSPVGLRMGYATIRVPLTVTEHVDLSAMS